MDLTGIADQTIKPASSNKQVLFESGGTSDIITVIMHADKESAKFTEDFAETFDGSTYDICGDVYDFVQENITYKEDPAGVQWIKSPSQLWADKVGDCKSYSIFIGSVLKNCNIPFVYRFVSFAPGDVTHVYVVAFDDDGSEIILDAVPPMTFNSEAPGITKRVNKKPAKEMAAKTKVAGLTPDVSAGNSAGTLGLLALVILGIFLLKE